MWMTKQECEELEMWKRRGRLIDRVCALAIASGGSFIVGLIVFSALPK